MTDRLKDIIITGGENVSPREVEEVIEQRPDAAPACTAAPPAAARSPLLSPRR